jgi:5-oxoprolinase (ATP-hydrolysing) subunit A
VGTVTGADGATAIDLNADLGELPGPDGRMLDAALLDVVTSANVACGFHAGDLGTMRETCERAAERGVQIGAHPSYLDRAGFGRRELHVPADVLRAQVAEQVGMLLDVAGAAGTAVRYVKPHGALYHRVARDEGQASAFLEGVQDVVRVARASLPDADVATARLGFALGSGASTLPGSAHADAEADVDVDVDVDMDVDVVPGPDLALVGPPESLLLDLAADAGLAVVREGFADRAYATDGTLVPRTVPGAVLHDSRAVAAQAVSLARTGTVRAVDGTPLRLDVATICLHGDTPGAVALAREVRAALVAAGVTPTPFRARARPRSPH